MTHFRGSVGSPTGLPVLRPSEAFQRFRDSSFWSFLVVFFVSVVFCCNLFGLRGRGVGVAFWGGEGEVYTEFGVLFNCLLFAEFESLSFGGDEFFFVVGHFSCFLGGVGCSCMCFFGGLVCRFLAVNLSFNGGIGQIDIHIYMYVE